MSYPQSQPHRLRTSLLLFAATVVSRLPFTSKLLFNHDSVQFALALDEFDVTMHQPHPPGYFLYVVLGRLAREVTGDANTAFNSISIVAGALSVVAVYLLALEMFDRRTALASALIAMSAPLVWFINEVALTNSLEGMASAVLAYLCYRIMKGEHGLITLAALTLGLSAGVRQSIALFMLPLLLYSMTGAGAKRQILGLIVLALAGLSWFLPMTWATGGYERYRAALDSQMVYAVWEGFSLKLTVYNLKHVAYYTLAGLLLAGIPLLAVPFLHVRRRLRIAPGHGITLFFLSWILPSLLFYTFIFFQPAAPGYILSYFMAFAVLSARATVLLSDQVAAVSTLKSSRILAAALGAIIAVNIAFFLYAPSPITWRGINMHDRVLERYFASIRENFSPEDTEIIGTGQFTCSFRHAMYYLPEYRVSGMLWVNTPGGLRAFYKKDGEISQVATVSPPETSRHYIDFIYNDPEKLPFGKLENARKVPGSGDIPLWYTDDARDLFKIEDRMRDYFDPALMHRRPGY